MPKNDNLAGEKGIYIVAKAPTREIVQIRVQRIDFFRVIVNMFFPDNGNTRAICKISSKLTSYNDDTRTASLTSI